MATAVLTFVEDRGSRRKHGTMWAKDGYLKSDDGDYAAGGLAVTASTFGYSRLDNVFVYGMAADGAGTAPSTAGVLFEGAYYDRTAKKIAFSTSAGDGDPEDESNTATLNGYTINVTAVGV